MRVLVGCECMGKVREAFLEKGHDAYSCDLEPDLIGSDRHHQGDLIKYIQGTPDWDLIIIHPPCTALTNTGNEWYAEGKRRHAERTEAIRWTKKLWGLVMAHSKFHALENPIGVLKNAIGQPRQIIQPWEFGHPNTKATCLWHNMPLLQPTSNLKHLVRTTTGKYDLDQAQWWGKETHLRRTMRSITYGGIARAMANQWGNLK